MLTRGRPSPPASMPGAGECLGTTAPLEGRQGCLVRERALVVVRGLEGVVALEDHPNLRHVTGSPPLQNLREVLRGRLESSAL